MPQDWKYDIFVSYSTVNRDRVIKIVDALEGMGVNVWIDRNRISGGTSFAKEIPPAIRSSKVVVPMCTSAFYRESKYTSPEIEIAFDSDREIVPLRLEDVPVEAGFELWLRQKQWIDVLDRAEDDWMSDFVAALEKFSVCCKAGHSAPGHPKSPTAARPERGRQGGRDLLLGLVNRSRQRDRLERVLDRHCKGETARPIFVLIHGDEEQDVDLYLDRLIKGEIGEILKTLKSEDEIFQKNIAWPGEPSDEHKAVTQIVDEHLEVLQGELNRAFEARISASQDDLLELIRNRRLPVVLWTKFGAAAWGPGHKQVLQQWLASWSEFPDLPKSQPLIVIIAVWYANAKDGLFGFLQNREIRRRKQAVSKALNNLAESPVVNLSADMLPELGNVTYDHVKNWAQACVETNDLTGMLNEIEQWFKTFDDKDAKKNGVPMRPLVTRLKELVDKY